MRKPQHPCANCKALISVGSLCASCKPQRPTSTQLGYGARWSRYSRAFLKRNPFCADPFGRHAGRLVEATVTGHRVAHKNDPALMWNEHNHYALCQSCNAYQCAKHEGGFGNAIQKRQSAS